jgi:RNA recognition motif-containing protein
MQVRLANASFESNTACRHPLTKAFEQRLGAFLSMKKIYVGNLPWGASEADVRDFFSTFGEVHSVAVITDRETGRSRGFGFVEMDDDNAERAISEANGRDMGGRPLRVNEAQQRSAGGGGGGGGRGGPRGGGGGGGRDRW